MAISEDRLLELYKLAIEEEQFFLSDYQKRITQYVSLIVAILGATVAGYFQSEHTESMTFIYLSVGPLMAASISLIAIFATLRSYRRYLIAIVRRGKLDARMGNSEPPGEPGKHPWANLPLVYADHMESRRGHERDFVLQKLFMGTNRFTLLLFILLAVFSIAMLGMLTVQAINA